MREATFFPCAAKHCGKNGKYSCSNCKLVSYCDRSCQVAHWSEHKQICKSVLMSAQWRPGWEQEGRAPSFATPQAASNPHNPFGNGRYLWGNVPAVDVLHMPGNEGHHYSGDIAVLFAASGDLRNVVQTISQLPDTFAQRLEITLNDREFHVVARNAILLLFCLTGSGQMSTGSRHGVSDIESLIHLWYSASLTGQILSQLAQRVKPLFADVCEGISAEPAGHIVEKTWLFSHEKSLRLALKKEDWFRLKALCEIPPDLARQEALDLRTAITLAPERRDYRDRWYYKDATPSIRVSKQRFREDGLLLPFGHSRDGFDIPNPTFYLPPYRWPMDDKAGPLDGWPLLDVLRIQAGAKEDLYGKLYLYLQRRFKRFLDRLATAKVDFELLHMDAIKLPETLEKGKYARIEVSNITDAGYLGTRETLCLLSPLLQPPRENFHATIISTYLNAVMEMVKRGNEKDQTPNIQLLMEYFPHLDILSLLQPESADSLKFWDARTIVLDRHDFFQRYTKFFQFNRICKDLHLVMKKHNTIVEAWPTMPKLSPEHKEAQHEFEALLGSNYTSVERFVEWKRMR